MTDPLRIADEQSAAVPFVDPISAFRGTSRCPGVIGNVAVHADDDPATDTYVKTAVPWLRRHIGLVIADRLAREVG